MGTALNYLEDVDKFEAFLELEKDNKNSNRVIIAHSLYAYIAMKEILIDLMKELKTKNK